MGKFKSWKYRSLFTNIATSTCLVGASAGIIFGVSAGTFKVNYADLNSADARVAAANGNFNYYSQNIKSQWNMVAGWDPHSQEVDKAKYTPGTSLWKSTESWWKALHETDEYLTKDGMGLDQTTLTADQIRARYSFASMVIDGSTHTTMDRSFNQSLYNGLVNFIRNQNVSSNDLSPETETDPVNKYCAKSFKPGGDGTTDFLNIFRTVASEYKVVGLAGFNHVTPLNSMGVYGNGEKDEAKFDKGKATNYRVKFDANNTQFNKTGFLLIDGDVANNQQVASVLFRSDQPGFLAAISTCMYFYNNLEIYHEGYKNLAVGAYGGTSIPTVTIYMGGFERGLEFFNKYILKDAILGRELDAAIAAGQLTDKTDLKKLVDASKFKDKLNAMIQSKQKDTDLIKDVYEEYSVKMIKLGDASTHFSGTFASGDAIGITKQFLNRGAGAIIAVAGPQSLDSAQEIQNQNSNCIVIGVDSAMEEGDYQRSFKNKNFADKNVAPDDSKPAQQEKIIKFSAVKDMTTVTQKFTELTARKLNFTVGAEGKTEAPDPNKAICGVGYKTCGNIQNGLISISWDGWVPFVQAMRHTAGYTVNNVPNQTFEQAWKYFADLYINAHSELDAEFKAVANDVTKLQTYNKTKNNIYKNYNHVTTILGEVLNGATIVIPKDMTVRETTRVIEGKTVIVYEKETIDQPCSILNWLKLNMYFTC